MLIILAWAALSAKADTVRIESAKAALAYDAVDVSFAPKCFAKGWIGEDAVSKRKAWEGCPTTVPFSLKVRQPQGGEFNGTAVFRAVPDGKVAATWVLAPDQTIELEQLYIGATLKMADYAGGTYVIDGKADQFPEAKKTFQFGWTKAARRLEVRDAKGERGFSLDFDDPVRLGFQDNSAFGAATYDLRFDFGVTNVRAGELQTLGFVLSDKRALSLKVRKPVTVAASPEWVPLSVRPFIEPGSALDFSSFRGTDSPAGCHGRVVARGDHFEFEGKPGLAQRFYGVNLCFSANYVDKAAADRLAAQLARVGYNAVRFHHHDNGLCAGADRTELEPEQAKKLDGLIAACIANGLYMTTDLFVSRQVPWSAIGEHRDGFIEMQEFKELVQAHEGAYRNFIAFARSFLNHGNVYTGRRNADEPALAWLSFVNEGNLGNMDMTYMARNPCFAEKYAAWTRVKRAAQPERWKNATGKLPKSLYDKTDPEVPFYELFLQELETQFAVRVTKFLREEVKSRQLTTNMNCWRYPSTLQLPRTMNYDFVDDHFYVDHPEFLCKSWALPSRCPNINPLVGRSQGVPSLTFRRVLNRPFTVSEYNYAAPGRYRGVGGIVCGAMAALQGWAGLWRFDWSGDALGVQSPEKKVIGYFDMAGDPLSMAAERASICLFLRRDLEGLKPVYGVAVPPAVLTTPAGAVAPLACDWNWAAWQAKIGNVVADAMPTEWRSAGPYPQALKKPDVAVRADLDGLAVGGGFVSVDGAQGTFAVQTPRTCGVFGEPGRHEAGALSCVIEQTAATIWVSALDSEPVSSSRRLLLTHLTDMQNSDCRYADEERKVLLDWGHLPHVVRAGRAQVAIRLDGASYAVYVLGTDGRRRREITATCEAGTLRFVADVAQDRADASFLYEIIRR
ncbi:MAG: hypothetical protein MJ240_04965 [Kiritimatiellae bacterium]|nr:hypothetical protein [Kiritimatiellia bacterium]